MRLLMGTWVVIEAQASSTVSAATERVIEHAFAAMADVASRMHPRREGSDLARIAAAPLDTPIEIADSTWRVLERAHQLYEWSAGAFDPALPSRPGRLSDVELTRPAQLVCRRSLALDLGGIAKGYAVDQAVSSLQAAGCTSGIVNAGGDLRVFGPKPQTLLLRRTATEYEPVQLLDSALAVSDVDGADPPAEHQGYYRRGQHTGAGNATTAGNPISGGNASVNHDRLAFRRRYAAVVAPDAMTADALTKCALFCSEEQLETLLARTGARLVSAPKR